MQVDVKKVSLTRKCHNHTLHANPRHLEEESKNNKSHIASVDLQVVAILTTHPQLGKVPLGNIKTLCLLLSDTNIFNVLYI